MNKLSCVHFKLGSSSSITCTQGYVFGWAARQLTTLLAHNDNFISFKVHSRLSTCRDNPHQPEREKERQYFRRIMLFQRRKLAMSPPSPEPGVCDYCHALLKGELIFMNSFRTMIPHHANLTALLTSSNSCPCCAFLVQSFNQTQIETWQREENTGETKHTPLGVHASLIGSSIYRIWVSHAGADIQGAYVYMRTSDGW